MPTFEEKIKLNQEFGPLIRKPRLCDCGVCYHPSVQDISARYQVYDSNGDRPDGPPFTLSFESEAAKAKWELLWNEHPWLYLKEIKTTSPSGKDHSFAGDAETYPDGRKWSQE